MRTGPCWGMWGMGNPDGPGQALRMRAGPRWGMWDIRHAELTQAGTAHARRATLDIGHGHAHDHGDHHHEERMDIEQKAVDKEGDDAERSRLTKALVKVLLQRSVLLFIGWPGG